jgi:hypothetical protein
VAECGQLVPFSVATSPLPPPLGLRCPTCVPGPGEVDVGLADTDDAVTVAKPSAQLVVLLALHRVHGGGVAKVGERYVDGGFPTPGYMAGTFEELVQGGLLALAGRDSRGRRQVTLTEAGHAWHAQLREVRRRAGLLVRPSLTTASTAQGSSGTAAPNSGSRPDPVRGRPGDALGALSHRWAPARP